MRQKELQSPTVRLDFVSSFLWVFRTLTCGRLGLLKDSAGGELQPSMSSQRPVRLATAAAKEGATVVRQQFVVRSAMRTEAVLRSEFEALFITFASQAQNERHEVKALLLELYMCM